MAQDTDTPNEELFTVKKLHHPEFTDGMSGRADRIFDELNEHLSIDEDGSYDFAPIASHTNHSRGNIYNTLARHGRLEHKTDDVDEPTIDVVRYQDTNGKADDHKKQRQIRRLIQDLAVIDPTYGTIDISPVLDHDSNLQERTVHRNVAKSTRVLVPPAQYQEPTDRLMDNIALDSVLSDADVEDERSFIAGWNEYRKWERTRGRD